MDSIPGSFRTHRWSTIAATFVLLVYLTVSSLMPKDVFWSPDEGIKFIITQMVRIDAGIRYDLPYRGASLDPDLQFYPSIDASPDPDNIYPFPQADGSIHLPWPIWFPLLASFLFHSFGTNGIYWLPLAAGWLTAVFAARLISRFEPSLEPWAILLVGLGTPVFFFSFTFWEHTLVAFLGIIIVCLVIDLPRRKSIACLSVFLLAFIAMTIRLEMIAYCIGLFIAGLLTNAKHWGKQTNRTSAQPVVFFALGLAIIVFLITSPTLIAERQRASLGVFGQIVRSNAQELESSASPLARYLSVIPDILINSPQADSPAIDNLWAWGGVLAFMVCFVLAPTKKRFIMLAVFVSSLIFLLLLSLIVVLMPQPYRSLHGILLIIPYAAVITYALRDAFDSAKAGLFFLTAAVFIYLTVGIVMLLGTRVDPSGKFVTGLEWGQRYLLPIYPLLAILSLIALQKYHKSTHPLGQRRLVTFVVLLLMMVGLEFEFRGIVMLHSSKRAIAEWQFILESQAREPIVTDLWWLPASLAPYFTTHEMYMVHPENANAWLDCAESRNMNEFTFVSQRTWSEALGDSSMRLDPEKNVSASGMQFTKMIIRLSPNR